MSSSAASALATPSLLSLFKGFFLNPAFSFPNAMYHFSKSSALRNRFLTVIGILFLFILFFRWMSTSLVGGSLFITGITVIFEAILFTALLTGVTSALKLGQLRFPLAGGLVVLGTHTTLVLLRESCFLFLPFLGKTSAICGGVAWLLVKIWVFGMAWAKGFRCDWLYSALLVALSVLTTSLMMTFLFKIFYD